MDRAGALEILMPALQPPEIWQQSGRYETAKGVLFKAYDRAKKEWVLGPTHEEAVTTLMAGELSSYRQLPKNLYQIQTKFRDEIRPRFGLMRTREFIMKDAYSFDATDEACAAAYQKMFDAYTRIFQRCGLRAIAVEADTGVMGGKFSHEFMVPAETGENEIVSCDACHRAANIEKAASRVAKVPPAAAPSSAPEKFATPGVVTIDALAAAPFHRPAGAPDQNPGLYRRRQARSHPPARRPSTQRGQAHRRAGHRNFPPRRTGGNFCGPPRPSRQPGRGRRKRSARSRR